MFSFRPSTIPQTVYVVGCGGTGSRLVPLLVQFLKTITKAHNPQGWLNDTNIVLIDGDIVEAKNLLRQNFIASDVNKNKAAVLAQRYGKAYGMNVIAYPEFISDTDVKDGTIRNRIPGLSQNSSSTEMVIMCVDSAEARRKILHALGPRDSYSGPTFFIDAGNEDDFGQVKFFTSHLLYTMASDKHILDACKNPERVQIQEQINFLPYDKAFYDNLVDNPGLGSCADLNQTLAINALMATLIMGVVQNYYYVKPFIYNEISIGLGGSVSMTYNTVANFRNKTVTDSATLQTVGMGRRYGFAATLTGMDASTFLKDYLTRNKKAIKALEKPVEEESVEKTKKKKPSKTVNLEGISPTLNVAGEIAMEGDSGGVAAGEVEVGVGTSPGAPESPFRRLVTEAQTVSNSVQS